MKQFDTYKVTDSSSKQTPVDGYVAGVDIGGTNLRLVLADGAGHIIERWSTKTTGIQNPHTIVALIHTGVTQLLQRRSIPRDQLRAIAAGAPGVVDVDTGAVITTSYLMGWKNVPLRALLEEALDVPAAIDNDVNVGALGESWMGAAKNVDDFVFIAIGSGVGAGIVMNRQLFQGKGWRAGEIGYMLVPGTSEKPVEGGKPGAFEDIVGGEGIRAQWQILWKKGDTSLPDNLTATEIFDAALRGDSLAQELLQQAARTLAYAINNITLILNTPLFVLGGRIGMHPALCNATRQMLEQRGARVQPRLMLSALGEDAQLTGAVRLALDTAYALESNSLRR